MNKNIRITENQLKRIVKQVISEQATSTASDIDEVTLNTYVDDAISTLDGYVDLEDLQNILRIVQAVSKSTYEGKNAMHEFTLRYYDDDEDDFKADVTSVGVSTISGGGALKRKILAIVDNALKAPAVQPAATQPATGAVNTAAVDAYLEAVDLTCVKKLNPTKKEIATNGYASLTFDGKPIKYMFIDKATKTAFLFGSDDRSIESYQNKWLSISCDASDNVKIDLPKAQVNESIKKEINRFADFAFYNKKKIVLNPKISKNINEQLTFNSTGQVVTPQPTTNQPTPEPTKQATTDTAPKADPPKKSQVYPAYSLDDVRNRKGMLYLGLKDNKGVGELQHFLNIPITNVFDAATKSAVQDFQRKNNLTPDGIVGKKTITAIETSKGQKSSEEMQRKADEFLAGKDAALGKLTGGINLPSSSTGLRRVSSNSQVTDTPTGGPTNVTPVGPDIDQQRADAGGYLSDADKKAQAEKRAAEIQQELDSPGSKLFRANWNTKLNFRDPATRRVIVWKGEQLSPTDLEYLNQHMAKGGYKLKKFKDKGDGDGKYVWVKS